ncbi:MAG: hypothetical protein KDC53_10525, partial [Saprospiraceae bacterium]|nr:hypothetical protein [Saprospiraceae bacterium]
KNPLISGIDTLGRQKVYTLPPGTVFSIQSQNILYKIMMGYEARCHLLLNLPVISIDHYDEV